MNYIFGTGKFANIVADQLTAFGVKIDGILELKSFYTPITLEKHESIPVIYIDDTFKIAENTRIFIAEKPMIMEKTILFLRKFKNLKCYIVSEEMLFSRIDNESDFYRYCYQLDFERPIMNYLETNIVDNCNLNCKGCAHFSNICYSNYVDVAIFERDIKKISKLVDLYYFRLLGGEPLLHPNLNEIVEIARSNLPKTRIVIVTNGLMIDKLSEKILKSLSDNDVTLCISVYKPTLPLIPRIIELLRRYNVKYIINDNFLEENIAAIDSFYTCLTDSKGTNGEEIGKMCVGRFCHFLRDGKISKCYYPLLIGILNEKCNMSYEVSDDDYVELDEYENGWRLIEKLNKTIPFCDYCHKKIYTFEWEAYHKDDLDTSQYMLKRER